MDLSVYPPPYLPIYACWSGTHYVDQTSLELTSSTCLYLPGAGVKDMNHHIQLMNFLLYYL